MTSLKPLRWLALLLAGVSTVATAEPAGPGADAPVATASPGGAAPVGPGDATDSEGDCPPLVVDGGLVVGMPAALVTGLATGVGVGITRGGWLAYGARGSWATTTEYTTAWTVNHDDFRLRLTGALQHAEGRGTFALRLGLGATLVDETRTRNQGNRAGLSGSALATNTFSLLPAGELELAVTLRIAGAWSMVVSGGPSLDLLDGTLHGGWIGGLGVSWRR